MKFIFLFLVSLFITSCNQEDTEEIVQENTGEIVFDTNCKVCHGTQGKGISADWQQPLANNKYPPPPLNGSAHTWHHSPKALLKVINNGGTQHGGEMPAFKDVLTQKEKQAVIDYFQSLWPNDIKEKYNKHFNTNIRLN